MYRGAKKHTILAVNGESEPGPGRNGYTRDLRQLHVTGRIGVDFWRFFVFDQRTSSQITDRSAPGAFYHLAVPKQGGKRLDVLVLG